MPSPDEVALANKAIRQGFLTLEDARECFSIVEQLQAQGSTSPLDEIFVARGYLSRAQLELIRQSSGAVPSPTRVATPPKPLPPTQNIGRVSPHAATQAVPIVGRTKPPEPPRAVEEIPEMQPIADGSNPQLAPLPPTATKKPTPKPAPRPPAPAAPPAAGRTSGVISRPAAAPSGAAPNPKEPIPGYQILGKLGAGGMASVFKAKNNKSGEIVALKILFPHHAKNELFLKRFVREAQLLVQFSHENIVTGIDAGCANGLYYLIMELLEGESLQDRLNREKALPEEQSLPIILQIAKGLEYIEGMGIVHRDIKPDNIILLPNGTVKMIDLGFAKPIGQPEDTATDMTCGTPQYMSPEQAEGAMDVDVRSDIYSLGATFYHMAIGDVPFKGTDNMEVMAQQVLADLKSSEVKSGKISRHVHYFLEKMMAKDKDMRYQNPREVIEDIEGLVAGFKSLKFDAEAAAPKGPQLLGPTPRGTADKGSGVREKPAGKDSGTFKSKSNTGIVRKSRLDEIRKKSGRDSGGGSGLFNFNRKK